MRRWPGPVLCAALLCGLAAAAASAEPQPPRSAAIDQVQPGAATSDRSRAALDQIGAADRRGAVDQIDPAARPRDPAAGAALLNAAPRSARASRACQVSPEQAAIIETLRAQGRILADDCDLVEWVAVSPGRSPADERRDLAERAAAGLPGPLTFTRDLAREREEAERQERLDEMRARAVMDPVLPPGR